MTGNPEIRNRYTGEIIVAAGKYANVREAAEHNKANLYKANLSGADLSGANLYKADLSGADLSGADLSGAYLYKANLSGANLYKANLSGADLSGANLSGAYLYKANLSGANLYKANLSGADLSGANLSGAKLSGAKGINKHKITPLLLLFDQPGKIRLYKLTDKNGDSPIQTCSKIHYEVGKIYEVKDAGTNDTIQCDAGVNVATLDWCLREYRPGWRLFLVEFTAKDIAAIPVCTDGKIRLFRCKVVKELDVAKYLDEPKEEKE